ncbi:fructosyl amine: oxygen oxidoreductase [Niveomyces insectorum RCEF 264]|uniref:Fructosyl amine: oxygen oxidoreductase n=1 Tax=Niveomyces insectorum RCEF 264 TaxID=1081102 RepID=A0A167XYR2_9HYPO|nr:fructosyl amine: oxygen oxidoreductase [Niveomyces insectorum RCEF 264]
MLDKQSHVLIVGGGTFGLSTAYHLARSGYTNVTVVEKASAVPSPFSAGNDLNKIVRAEYVDPFYSDLALEAIAEWANNPVFAPFYHETGYLLGVSGAAGPVSRATLARQLASLQKHPAWAGKITPMETRADLHRVAPALDGPMPGWTGYFNTFAGYAHAANAMRSVYGACAALGVHFELGQAVTALVYDDKAAGRGAAARRCVGVTTATGRQYTADVVLLTLGGSIGRVLPSVGRQIVAKAWALAHVQLTPDEARRLAGIPVTFMRDLGFFFEPEPGTGLFKVCAEGAGYSNFESSPDLSVAPADEATSDFLPARGEQRIRKLLSEALPALADRPLLHGHVCWCADTEDMNYVIDRVPDTEGLFVATGDAGHGFKMLPVVGKWIQATLEKGQQPRARWQWKTGTDGTRTKWRSGTIQDLKDARPAQARL